MSQTLNHSTKNNIVYRLKNVIKTREKGGNRFELHIPDFTIHAGEFVAIVGESGCGKSTLLDMLGLIMSPTTADDFLVRAPETRAEHHIMQLAEVEMAEIRKTHLGYVLQTGGLLPFLSVEENVLLPCSLNGMNEVEEHVYKLVERLGIAQQMPKKPQFLSGGQRQRAAIARALAHRPPIVLADEPTAAVDKITAREIRDTFKELTQQMGVALLMVTHDEPLVKGFTDRTFVFELPEDQKTETFTLSICKELQEEDTTEP